MLNSVFEGVRFIFFAWLGLPQPCSPPCPSHVRHLALNAKKGNAPYLKCREGDRLWRTGDWNTGTIGKMYSCRVSVAAFCNGSQKRNEKEAER